MSGRPLVVRFGALGDMVLLTVIIRHLAQRFAEPVDILGSGPWTEPLFAGQPGIGRIILAGSRKRPYWFSPAQRAAVRALRAREPGPTWLCDQENGKSTQLLVRAGWRREHWCHYEGLRDVPGPHFCDLWLRFAYRDPAILGGVDHPLTAHDAWPALGLPAVVLREFDAWLAAQPFAHQPLILLQAGNKRTMRRAAANRASNLKYWPEAHWASVLQGLRERHPDAALLMLGVANESALNERILALAAVPGAYNLARDMSIGRLMGLCARARGMVSVDTGPAHVASAVGCRAVVLFGKTDPRLYAPRGPGGEATCLTGQAAGEVSMRYITPPQVLAAWAATVPMDAQGARP